MNRLASFSIAFVLFFSSGCMTYTAARPNVSEPPWPYYVYAYADGSCWADDVWYAACPWVPGPRYGYYVYGGGYYYWQPQARWHVRTAPPPSAWRYRHHHHHYRYSPVPHHHRHPRHHR